jgi:cytosine permease
MDAASDSSVDASTAAAPSLRAQIEDHALTPVPQAERRSGWGLVMNTAGISSTLVQLSIGGGVTLIAGVWWGLLAGVLVAVFGGLLGWLVGHVAYVSGTSSTVTSRFYGLGVRGSVIASLIFAFMILGFLALENALLYYGTLFILGWAPSLWNAVLIYGVLTVVWILLTTFGLKLVQRTSTVLLAVAVVLTVVLAVIALSRSGLSVGHILSGGPVVSGFGGQGERFAAVLSILAGSAGALALTGADFTRYARSTKDVGIVAIGGAIMVDIFIVVLGTLILHAGGSVVARYLGDHPDVAAGQGGAAIQDKVAWMADNNSGAYFIVLAGLVGFLLMYAAQAKAQVLNTYSGSLALSNLVDGLTGRNVGRFAMVVAGNVIALLMVAGDILGLISGYLGILGVTTTALAGVIVADYFVVRRRQVADRNRVEAVNWAGVVSVVVASVTGGVLCATGVTSLGFLVSLLIVVVLYPLLRLSVLREGTATRLMGSTSALDEES